MKGKVNCMVIILGLVFMSCGVIKKDVDTPPHIKLLDEKYQKIRDFIGETMYGKGGLEVLTVGYKALREKQLKGEAHLVGIEDLWAHALQEGLSLFNKPDKLWGHTTAEETHDMIGQTTIGPWQITVQNVKNIYGIPYGVKPEWSNNQVYAFCREHPEIQAKMIIDYIQLSYTMYGKRSVYAIQRYFWLEPFVKGEIGQGPWTNSPVAIPPEGKTWKDLTPEMLRNTGLYAKQILLGTRYNHRGLLFWLWVTGDIEGIKEVLRTWRDQKKYVWQEGEEGKEGRAIPTDEPGNFAIKPEDIVYGEEHPQFQKELKQLVIEILEEKK